MVHQGIVEIQGTGFVQQKNRHGGELLRHRGQPEDRPGADGSAGLDIRQTIAPLEDDLAPMDHHHHGTRRLVVLPAGEHGVDRRVALFEGLGRPARRRLATGTGQAQQQEDDQNGGTGEALPVADRRHPLARARSPAITELRRPRPGKSSFGPALRKAVFRSPMVRGGRHVLLSSSDVDRMPKTRRIFSYLDPLRGEEFANWRSTPAREDVSGRSDLPRPSTKSPAPGRSSPGIPPPRGVVG